MSSHDRVSRFYGLPITSRMRAAATERLTGPGDDDLVRAHLAANYAYFGAIDKTLAGFYVLDDEGDDYTLLDVRGDGRVWWQDHETRELYARFDTLEDWISFTEELKAGGDRDKLMDAYRTARPAPADAPVTPSTVELAERYQWLVWLLAQPLRDRRGTSVQTDDELARGAAGHLCAVWPTDEAAEAALDEELPRLSADPHLAVYWLLHTSLLAMEERRARVLAAIGPQEERPPLVEAFASVFGTLPPNGDVPVVPGFRARRSLVLLYTAGTGDHGPVPRAALLSMEMAPDVLPLRKFHLVLGGLEDGTLAGAEVAAVAERMDAALGTTALRALLDQRSGRPDSAYADELARTATRSGEDWTWVFAAVRQVHSLIRDAGGLASVTEFLLGKDPYHRRVLRLAERAQELAGRELFMPAGDLRRASLLAEESATVLNELVATPEDGSEIIARVTDPELTLVIARRILHRLEVDEYPAEVSTWAIRTILASGAADRTELAAKGLAALPAQEQAEVLAEVTGGGITSADDSLVAVLLRILEHTPDPDEDDFLATMTVEDMKEEILRVLAPIAHHPEVFDHLMRLAELPAGATTVEPLWNKLFNPFEEKSHVLPRLTGEQAVRAARAMVANRLSHPAIGARSAAGHQLYRFGHVGAQDYLIEALDEYGRRYAGATPEGGKVFDHGQTEDELLEDVVANLYSAVRNMKTPRSRTALIERLFTERRSYWRMGNAIGEIFSAEIHHETMSALRTRHDGLAAGCYAYALAGFVQQLPPKVELLRELVSWPVPQEETARRFFAYALVIGIDAALSAEEYDLVRAARTLASSIAEQPLEPDDHARGRGWSNPLEDRKQAARLEAVLSGQADARRRRLLDKGVAARAAGRPRRKISDKSLGILAGVTVARRILHDTVTGEVWFLDTDGGVHAFDGYELAEPPFQVLPAGYGRMREFLAGAAELSERALFWDVKAVHYTEIVRYGDRITLRWGRDNAGSVESLGLVFPAAGTAAEAFTRLRARTAASGMTESSPWYVKGKGAVIRTYHTPAEDGGSGENSYLSVFDGKAEQHGPRYPSEAEAIAVHQRLELQAQRDHNACLGRLEWTGDSLRPEDMTVRQWIRGRIRDDSRDAAWHVRALTEITGYLTSHGYGDLIGGIEVELGAGVSDEEIAAFEAERRHPVPEVLRAFWREIGHARWSVAGTVGMRVLSPAQMLDCRPVARRLGRTYLAAMSSAGAEAARSGLESLDLLVELFDGAEQVAVTVVADQHHDDGRVFTHTYEGPDDFWWEKSLSWMFATRFLDEFADVVEATAPVVAQLYHGQRLNPAAERRSFELRRENKPARFWELFHDPLHSVVSTREGKVGAVGAVETRRYDDPARAARKAAKLIAAKEAAGYRETTPATGRG